VKKLVLILITLASLSPSLAWADAGGSGPGVIDDGEFSGCQSFNCHCTKPYPSPIIGTYQTDITTTKSAEECEAACFGYYVDAPEDEAVVTHEFTCTDDLFAPQPPTVINEPIFPQLNVILPGLGYVIKDGEPFWSEAEVTTVNGVQNSNLLGTYVKALYGYLLGAASLIAVTMLMIAGLQYATARGDSKQVEGAKKRIGNAIAGIILLLLAYNIAFLINPATTTFDSLGIQNIKGIEINDETPVNFEEDFLPTNEEGPISVPLKNQKDFATTPYGPDRCLTSTSGNIKSSGCGVVSFAMVAEALSGTSVDPAFVAEVFYNDGQEPSYRPLNAQGCGENGTYNSAMYENPLIDAYGLSARQIPINDAAELRELVTQGKLIITSYRTASGGGHYVVVSGFTDDGRLIVSNPWGGTREARTWEWWMSTIKSAAYIDTDAAFIP
jgi:hypothetical protein